jgi:hypothetical protein
MKPVLPSIASRPSASPERAPVAASYLIELLQVAQPLRAAVLVGLEHADEHLIQYVPCVFTLIGSDAEMKDAWGSLDLGENGSDGIDQLSMFVAS